MQLRKLFTALADQFGDAVQHCCALVGFALRPAAVQEGLVGALYGFFDIVEAGGIEPGHGLAAGRVTRGVAFTAAQAPGAGDADG
ncbi:hypothetical protein D3C84_971870 [compost metagenome]